MDQFFPEGHRMYLIHADYMESLDIPMPPWDDLTVELKSRWQEHAYEQQARDRKEAV